MINRGGRSPGRPPSASPRITDAGDQAARLGRVQGDVSQKKFCSSDIGLSFPGKEEARSHAAHTAGDTDTAHDGGDQEGLHDDDILVLTFLRIAIANQLFQFISRP
jgi:hypothetical protein